MTSILLVYFGVALLVALLVAGRLEEEGFDADRAIAVALVCGPLWPFWLILRLARARR